jgi:hypothetical protein
MADSDSEQYLSSREKSKAGRGTNGDPNFSSVTPGKPQPKLFNESVAPPQTVVPPRTSDGTAEWQTRVLDARARNVPVKAGMRNRSGEGAVIAQKIDHAK